MKRTDTQDKFRQYQEIAKKRKYKSQTTEDALKSLYGLAKNEETLNTQYDTLKKDIDDAEVTANQKVLTLQDLANKYLPYNLNKRGLTGLGVANEYVNNANVGYDARLELIRKTAEETRNNLKANYDEKYSEVMYDNAAVNKSILTGIGEDVAEMERMSVPKSEIYKYLQEYANDNLGKEYQELLAKYKEAEEVEKTVEQNKKEATRTRDAYIEARRRQVLGYNK